MSKPNVLALSGGVGGAKLALGLAHLLPPENLTVVANTGDDFTHLGLRVCPDIDTVIYTLSDLADKERGWGRAGETWNFMAALSRLGSENWFNLGDSDLAMHIHRTERLKQGATLSEVTAEIASTLGIKATVIPMTDDPVATIVETPDGPLAFQHYFVRERCQPAVTGFRFEGIEAADPAPIFAKHLENRLDLILVTPSNPFVSIEPILSLPGVRDKIAKSLTPVIAVSPIVGGKAIKGPAAKMMAELGMPASALEVARAYRDVIDGFVIDVDDEAQVAEIEAIGMKVLVTNTVMNDLDDRITLARDCCDFAGVITA